MVPQEGGNDCLHEFELSNVGGVHMEPRDGSQHLNLFDAQFLA